LVAYHHRDLARPWGAVAGLTAMALWTALMSFTNGTERGRRWWWTTADLAMATAALLFTAYVDKPDGLLAQGLTLTGPWTAPSVLSCAILGGRWIGLLASTAIIMATIALPGGWLDLDTLDNLFLLVVSAGAVGLVARLLDQAQQRMRRLVELEAATADGWPRRPSPVGWGWPSRSGDAWPTWAAPPRSSADPAGGTEVECHLPRR